MILTLAFVATLLLNAWATRAVLHDDFFSGFQCRVQVSILSCLPVVGAALMLMLKRHQAIPRWSPFASGLNEEDLDANDDCVPDGLTVDDVASALLESAGSQVGDGQAVGD